MFVDVSQETANISLLIIVCINVCIMTPIQIYFMYRFWQYKEKKISFFTKRHPSLVMFNCIVFNLYPLLIRPVVDYLRLNQHISNNHPLTTLCVNIPQLFSVLLALRLWLLYYDWNHSIFSLSIKWKSQIAETSLLPWTFRYKYLSDLRILAIIGSVVGAVFMLFVVYVACAHLLPTMYKLLIVNRGGEVFYPEYISFFQMIGFVIASCVILMTFKIRSCRDHLFIRGTSINKNTN